MDPLTMGLISGGANLLGSIFSSTTSASNTAGQIAAQQQMQGQAEQFNAGQAQLQRDYQTQMSNTAYQRASQDMTKAGLNPMMMFGSGGAASTPSGGSASIGTPSVPMPQRTSPFAGLGDAVNKAINSAVDMKTFDRMTQEIANMRTSQRLTDASIRTEAQRPEDVAAAAELKQAEARRTRALQPTAELAGTSAADVLSGVNPTVRRGANIGKWGAGAVSDVIAPFVNSAGAVRRFLPTRSTSERASTGPSGDTSSFEERWDNMVR